MNFEIWATEERKEAPIRLMFSYADDQESDLLRINIDEDILPLVHSKYGVDILLGESDIKFLINCLQYALDNKED